MIYLDNAATTKPSRELLDIYRHIEEDFLQMQTAIIKQDETPLNI